MKVKEVLKVAIYILLVIVGVNLSMWLFNHINAWVGILSIIVISVTVLLFIINYLNKNENEKK